MKYLAIGLLALMPLKAQNVIAWKATTGDVVLVAAGTKATVQKTTADTVLVYLDKITIYCSVACDITQTANGTNASATAGTISPVLPESPTGLLPFNFYTASNVGSGTDQGGIIHLPAASTIVLCLARACGNATDVILGTATGGSGRNYTVVISSITGTANVTYFGRVSSGN